MGYNKEDYARVKAEYSQKYIAARQRAEEKRMELHGLFPRVREIDYLLSRTGMDIMGAIGSGETEARIKAIRERNDALLAERGRVLRDGGYPEDYSDIKYECEKCGDTGYVDIKMCDCMKRALVLAGYESSGIGALMRTQSFENFSLNYYKVNGNPEAMKHFVEQLKKFADGFGKDTYKNFLFIGGTGLGKTHLSTSVAKRVIDGGNDVLYVTAVGMIGDYEEKRFGDGRGAGHDLSRYNDADLLIIDDLGTEVTNQFTLACIYDVINNRINRRKCTIINTNLSAPELESRYSERIYSRLIGEYIPIPFKGTDIRKQKIQKSKQR